MDKDKNEKSLKSNGVFISETFRRFLFPTILSLLGGTICNFSDGIIVGNILGPQGLAAMGIVTPVFFIFTTLGSLIGVGGATLAAIREGSEDFEGVNRLFTISLAMMLASGFIISALGLVLLEPLLTLLGAQGAIREMAREYCLYFIPGAWTTMLLYIPLNFFRITGRPGIGAGMFGIMAVSNIGLSLFFMLVLDMGMSGAALGTVLGTTIALLYSLYWFFDKKSRLRLRNFKSEIGNIPSILSTGSPMALTNLLNVLRTLFYNRLLLAVLGSVGVTVFAVITNVGTFTLAILSGVSQTLVPLTGVFFGERDNMSVRLVMKTAVRWGMWLAAGTALVIAVLWRPICLMFGLGDASMFPDARFALIMFGLSIVPAMLSNLYQFHYMTIRKVWLANTVSVSRCFALPVLVSLAAALINPHWVWTGLLLGELLTIPVFFSAARLYGRKKKLSRSLLLDDSEASRGRTIAFSVENTVEAVMDASQKITEFCEANELDEKRTMLISLSIEELLLSIKDNAFREGETDSMDVRVFVTDKDVIMRIRNGGREFDPIRFFQTHPDDIDLSLGIQMIVSSAKDVRYMRTLGVNNLTVLV